MMIDWLKSLGDIDVVSDGHEIRVNCPFCSERNGTEDTKKHLYVSLDKPVANCKRCDWSGHYVSLVMSVEGCSYADALVYMETPLLDINKFKSLFSPRGLVCTDYMISQPNGFISFVDYVGTGSNREAEVAWRYLVKTRRIPENIVLDYWGYVPGSNRVYVLIDKAWWQGRLFVGGKPKYISPPWPKNDSLWNGGALHKYDTVAICEGVISAIFVGEHAIALCGKSATSEQIKRLACASAGNYVITLDSDAKEQPYVIAKALVLAGYRGTIQIQHMLFGDPADGMYGIVERYDWQSELSHILFTRNIDNIRVNQYA